MWRIQSLVGRVLSRCHGNAQLRLSQGHHVEDEVINSSILTGGRHASDSSSSHSSHDQKKKRASQFCYTGLPRYTALDAVGWGAAAVLFMQLCRRIHSRLSSHTDQNPGPAQIQKCSYKVLIDILSRPDALSSGVAVKCLHGALQTPDSGSSDRSHGNSDGDVTSDLQTAHSSDDQQEEPASGVPHCDETLFPEHLKPEEGVSLDAAAQNLRRVADGSVPVILNIIGLESARAGDYETAFSCFLASAQHDYSKAQFNLGVCYEKGRGMQTDLSKAVHYYRRAAVAGHRQAQYRCAKLLLSSRGQQSSETDTAAALNFLQTAADAGLTEAQVYLGVVLSQRPDCDEKKCVHYFRVAAESGDTAALVCLAQCYETGFGVSPCVQTAVSLYHQAAVRGNQQARDALRDRHSRDVLRSIRSAPCFSVIGQLNLNSMFPQEKPRPQQRSACQSQPLPHSWSTGSLSVSLQMLSAESSRKKKPPRENVHRQLSTSSSGSLSPGSTKHSCKQDWKYIASEKTTNNTYLCLAVLNGVLCVIFLHGRSSPQASPSATPCLTKSLSFEGQPLEEEPDKLLAPMHYARSGLGIAALNDRVITAGGYNREECLRTVECYNMKTDSWSFIAPMRTPRARFQMAVLMGQLYVMGGSNGHSDELSCGETYNPSADKWTQVPELRTNRCNAGVCALNNKLYVVGGSDPCGQKGLKNCDVFDPVSKAWTSCAPLNIKRHQAAVCELDGFMYVIGGAESWNCLNSVECYNPENNIWTLVAPMNIARRGAGVAVHEGKLFVVGGFDGSHALHCVEMYDPAHNEWRMLGSMNSPRSNAGAAVLGDIIYAVGGFDGNDFLNSVEAYSPKTDEWSPCADAFTNS